MGLTRRRLLGLVAAAPVAVLATASPDVPADDDTLTVFRAGQVVLVKDASGETVYVSAGTSAWAKIPSAQIDRLAALIAARPAGEGA